jgi:hypothetical protein
VPTTFYGWISRSATFGMMSVTVEKEKSMVNCILALNIYIYSQLWWYILTIPALRR